MAENQLKLLIIGERFFPEEFLINDVVDHLLLNNIQCEIITFQPSYPIGRVFENYNNSFYSLDKYKQAKVHRISFIPGYNKSVFIKTLNYLWFAIAGMVLVLIKSFKYDKILIYQTGPLTQSLIGIAAKFKSKKPLYNWTWDLWPDSVFAYGFRKNRITKKLLDSFVKFIYNRVDQIWISSPGFTETISKLSPNKQIHFVPNWVLKKSKIVNFDQNILLPHGFNITFTGNIGKVQNLENVLLGFSKAVRIDNNIFLNLVGDGSALSELKLLAQKMQIPNLKFWGKYPYDTMDEFYKQSEVLLISLKSESVWGKYIPSKFQTYLEAGKPILGVLTGAVERMINESKIGKCANPESIDEICDSILAIKNDILDYSDTKEKSNKILNSTFNRDLILKDIIDLIEK